MGLLSCMAYILGYLTEARGFSVRDLSVAFWNIHSSAVASPPFSFWCRSRYSIEESSISLQSFWLLIIHTMNEVVFISRMLGVYLIKHFVAVFGTDFLG